MLELIISIIALLISAFGFYKLMSFEADSLIADCENLDIYDDLEARIDALEYGIRSNSKNIQVLASQISDLQVELKKSTGQMINTSESINNIVISLDLAMAKIEENKKQLDQIQNNVSN